MIRAVAAVLFLLVSSTANAAECVRWVEYTTFMRIPTGKTVVLIPQVHRYCAEWKEEESK